MGSIWIAVSPPSSVLILAWVGVSSSSVISASPSLLSMPRLRFPPSLEAPLALVVVERDFGAALLPTEGVDGALRPFPPLAPLALKLPTPALPRTWRSLTKCSEMARWVGFSPRVSVAELCQWSVKKWRGVMGLTPGSNDVIKVLLIQSDVSGDL